MHLDLTEFVHKYVGIRSRTSSSRGCPCVLCNRSYTHSPSTIGTAQQYISGLFYVPFEQGPQFTTGYLQHPEMVSGRRAYCVSAYVGALSWRGHVPGGCYFGGRPEEAGSKSVTNQQWQRWHLWHMWHVWHMWHMWHRWHRWQGISGGHSSQQMLVCTKYIILCSGMNQAPPASQLSLSLSPNVRKAEGLRAHLSFIQLN